MEIAPTAGHQPHRLYQALAITGILVGMFIIAAGLYLLIARPSCCDSMNMGSNKMMEQPMNAPSMSPMPGMPTASSAAPTP
jgi:hypothetical protein